MYLFKHHFLFVQSLLLLFFDADFWWTNNVNGFTQTALPLTSHFLKKPFFICSQLDYTSLVRWTNISSIIPQSTINWKNFFLLTLFVCKKNDLVEKISTNVPTGKDRDRQAFEQIPLSKFHKFWRTTIWWPWYQARRRQGFDLSGINQLAHTSPTAGAKQIDGQRWISLLLGKLLSMYLTQRSKALNRLWLV